MTSNILFSREFLNNFSAIVKLHFNTNCYKVKENLEYFDPSSLNADILKDARILINSKLYFQSSHKSQKDLMEIKILRIKILHIIHVEELFKVYSEFGY